MGGELRVGIARDVVNMAPWLSQGASVYIIQQNVYDNLINYDDDGNLAPELAVSWEVVDPQTYVIHLREGVVFHDGDTFDAEDAKVSLDMMRDPTGTSALAPQLADVEEVNVLDPYTVELKLSQPNVVVFSALASSTAHILSKEWLEAGHDLNTEMNGTGPFIFSEFEPGVQTVLVKNEHYWKEGMPYLDKVIAVPYRDDSARINALLSSEVNFIEYVPYIEFDRLKQDDAYSMYAGVGPYNFLHLNVNEPPFDDARVRQALNYLIDRDLLIQLTAGGAGVPIEVGLLQPDDPYYNEDLARWKFDPDKALELLQEAGYENFSDISFVLTCSTVTVHKDPAEAIQATLQGFGMNVEIKYIDVPTLLDYRQNGGYVAMMDGQSAAYQDPDAYSAYFETGAPGYSTATDFSDETLDELLAKGRVESDFETRKQIYHDFEERLLELTPWYFGYFRPQGEAMEAKVKGYRRWPGLLGAHSTSRFEYVWIEE
ncbi:ABC transporter substrate-binding protein [Pseudoruegeria sp. HB172150]|uniref:ABC transporter substrate-binding protein n=1 Tax=Pseudoruegeria sp. HB172150 TaxID=2721164 RepID=UPI001556D1A0|nr:ABC transporter substrate-binding protein [Pseudoruegeria sp. HB172150]